MIPQIMPYFAYQELISVLACLAILTVILSCYVLPNIAATRAVRSYIG